MTSNRSRSRMRIVRLSVLLPAAISFISLLWFVACSSPERQTTVRVWHFWSEPLQRTAFHALVDDYERANPGVTIELTELGWSDGKAKLQSAFATGTAPDIVHLGLEWVQEFASAGVLSPLDTTLVVTVPAQLRSSVSRESAVFAVPWVMNTRALFVRNDVLEKLLGASAADGKLYVPDVQSLRIACGQVAPDARIGVQSYEPHNVVKKVLPFLWSSGSSIFLRLPFSASVDTLAVAGLEEYCAWARAGIMESSRALDARLGRRELGVWISGMWNLSDTEITRTYSVMPSFPSLAHGSVPKGSGSSVLSADCFAVNTRSTVKDAAQSLLRFLCSQPVSLRFCAAVPDAGFPCVRVDRSVADAPGKAVFSRPLAEAFYAQTLLSVVLPASPIFLQAEEILEQEVTEAAYGRKSPVRALADARVRLQLVETSAR